MKKLLTWAKNNPYKVAVTAIAFILAFLLFSQCNKTNVVKKKLAVSEFNIKALNDSVRQVVTKDGKPEFDKYSLLVEDINQLKRLNMELAEEVKKTKGRVAYITKVGATITQHDTTYLPAVTQIVDSAFVTSFSKDTVFSKGNSRHIAGYAKYDVKNGESTAAITQDSINMSFITGIKGLDKGKPEIFVRSDYPGFYASSLEGAVLDPSLFKPKNKQRLITIGLHIGYTPVTYSFLKQKVNFDPTQFGASIGANINLLRLLGK